MTAHISLKQAKQEKIAMTVAIINGHKDSRLLIFKEKDSVQIWMSIKKFSKNNNIKISLSLLVPVTYDVGCLFSLNK